MAKKQKRKFEPRTGNRMSEGTKAKFRAARKGDTVDEVNGLPEYKQSAAQKARNVATRARNEATKEAEARAAASARGRAGEKSAKRLKEAEKRRKAGKQFKTKPPRGL